MAEAKSRVSAREWLDWAEWFRERFEPEPDRQKNGAIKATDEDGMAAIIQMAQAAADRN